MRPTRLPSSDPRTSAIRTRRAPTAALVTAATTAATATAATAATAAVATVALIAAVAGPFAAPAGAANPKESAQAEYEAALKAANDQGVHYVSSAKQTNVVFSVSGDTGVKSGTQTLSLQEKKVKEHMTVVLVGSTGYANGNAAALHNIIGLANTPAKKYAGKWLSFPATNQQYAQLVTGLLNSQVANELTMVGPFHYGTAKTIDGKSTVAVVGKVSDGSGETLPATLYVPASGTPYPVEQTTGSPSSKAVSGTVTFTKWGQHVTQKAPTHTVSLTKLVPVASSGTTTG